MNKTFAIVAAVILVLLGALYFTNRKTVVLPSDGAATTTPEQNVVIDPSATSTTVNGYTIERVTAIKEVGKYPIINRALPTSMNGLSAEAHAAILKSLSKVATNLAKNPGSVEDWMLLGTYRQLLGDYEGAKEAWVYVGSKGNIAQAYENLGNLYANYLRVPTQVEVNYKKAIALDALSPQYYRTLAEWYTSVSRNADAEKTLRAGIVAVPKALDLQVVLARLLVSIGRISDARPVYLQAIQSATVSGQTELAAQITAEMNK